MKVDTQTIPIGEFPTGEVVQLYVTTIDSEIPGPTTYIQANIHGPEIAGTPVVQELIKKLPKLLQNGKVMLVPHANPWGTNTKIGEKQLGYTNLNGDSYKNWNRIYPNLWEEVTKRFRKERLTKELLQQSLKAWYDQKVVSYQAKKEVTLAYTLLKLALQADYIVDIHTAGNCIHHVYTFPHQLKLAQMFGVSHVVELPYDYNQVFDESLIFPWANYCKNKNDIPIQAFTLELDGDGTATQETVTQGVSYIESFLTGIKQTDGEVKKLSSYQKVTEENHHVFSPTAGFFMPQVKLGQQITRNEELGFVTKVTGEQVAIKSPFTGVVYQLPPSQMVETGQTLLGIFADPQELI